ncbi:RNA-directed DNA polymerase from retron ec67 [Xenorhabdus bovienii str. kraussei Quebec]|uniref:RNA-directed DNA polymerase n=1 Tax=Xenorhabdus bovienii str. kraussei Quebec TaxID=1398203 RepID=A0A077PMV6_XENBV|nr:TIR domain-containing anti-phage reverse transcriptase [Xenorhabdus bovienii]CDH22046.1 RNA-directed DNA polymerase from retron ec67 [Xenorhabdus bovienii str. kraussei Quebec]
MGLREKIASFNNELNYGVDYKDSLIPLLKNNEPLAIHMGNKVLWNNFFKKNEFSLTDIDVYKITTAISKKNIYIISPQDVAALLEVPVGNLLYLLYKSNSNKYREFTIPKKNGDKRTILSPQGGVKILQERAKKYLDAFYRPKASAHGFILNKSIFTNAEKHVKKKYVLNVDIKDFFESITFPRIYGVLKKHPFNMGNSAAAVFAQLCVHEGRLPQGAPTSPVVSNIIASSLDKTLVRLARKYKMSYTRYADDITFSFNQYPPVGIARKIDGTNDFELGDSLRNAIESNGFKINNSKFRLQSRAEKQVVTGLTVNEKVNINRDYIRTTRAMIDGWGKDRFQAAKKYHKIRYGKCDKSNQSAIISLRNHIYGRLSFIRMIRGAEWPLYLKLISRMANNDDSPTVEGKRAMKIMEMFDVFLCHASEDKDDIVEPLYEELVNLRVNAFLDTKYIKWGDSLIEKINGALAKSKFVIAVLSRNSVEKKWPLKELNSVLAREITGEDKKLLILVKDGDEELIKDKFPLLVDKLYLVYKNNPEIIAGELLSLLAGKQ